MNDNMIQVLEEVRVKPNPNPAECTLTALHIDEGVSVYDLNIRSDEEFVPEPVTVEWKFPAIGVKGVWKPTADFSKRIEADWELQTHESRISIDAPVMLLFGSNDENVLCFSCANAINRIEMSAKYREEDNNFYCSITFFTECRYPIKDFSTKIRIDQRHIHFSRALTSTSLWWEGFENLKPAIVPSIARMPLYSTWYQFHQNLDKDQLISECKLAKELGFEAIIIDDGWQTRDNNRGYDYTGDWKPDRFPDMTDLVKSIQQTGMGVGLWYSVPFCGRKSEAYNKFKGKFLTENHRWAPVFDPRYPEVREYLVGIYSKAVKNWGLDGLKLDFIDDFKAYPDTPFDHNESRDFSSINDAVDQLLSEVSREVKKINPEIFIEFRQKYTGPAMRKYGNMLRAFDCPGDFVMNRVRIADIRMLSGDTAVHSDMVKWHFDEEVEHAAIHYMNTLFGVPQISMMLADTPISHKNMVRFYTAYWRSRSQVLLSKDFLPTSPMANYPVLQANNDQICVVGIFENQVYKLASAYEEIDILNAKLSSEVMVSCSGNFGKYDCRLFDCQGNLVSNEQIQFEKATVTIEIPFCGMFTAKKM